MVFCLSQVFCGLFFHERGFGPVFCFIALRKYSTMGKRLPVLFFSPVDGTGRFVSVPGFVLSSEVVEDCF